MARGGSRDVIAQVLGGDKKVFDGVSDVGDVRRKMNLDSSYQAMINGDAADDDDGVDDNDFVSFSRKVKGGAEA